MQTGKKQKFIVWIIWLIAVCLYFMQYNLLVFPAAIEYELKTSMGIDPIDYAFITSAAYYTYAFMQVPVGFIYDRFSLQKIMLLAAFSMILGCLLFYSQSYYAAILGRLLMGFGGSFTFIGALYITRLYFSAALFPLLVALIESSSGLGDLTSIYVFSYLVQFQAWPNILLEMSTVLIFLFFLIVFIIPNDKPENIKPSNLLIAFRNIIKNKTVLLLGLNCGCMFSFVLVIGCTWGITFLKLYNHIDTIHSTVITSFLLTGLIIGCIVIGLLAKYIQAQKLLWVCSLFQNIAATYIVFSSTVSNPIIEMLFFFIIGFFSGGVLLNFSLLKNAVSPKHYGIASGFLNMFFCFMGIILSPIVGYIFTNTGNIIMATLPISIAGWISFIICSVMLLNYSRGFNNNYSE